MSESVDYQTIGQRLRLIRGDLSQAKFGALLGVSQSYVKNTEGGSKPSLEYLTKIVEYYNVSFDWILKGLGEIPTNQSNWGKYESSRTAWAGGTVEPLRIRIAKAVSDSQYTVEEIAQRMSTLLNVQISDAILKSWSSMAPGSYVMPVEYFPTFVEATKNLKIIKDLATLCSVYALSEEQMAAVLLLLTPEKRIEAIKSVIKEGFEDIADPSLQDTMNCLKKMTKSGETDIRNWAGQQLSDVIGDYLYFVSLKYSYNEFSNLTAKTRSL